MYEEDCGDGRYNDYTNGNKGEAEGYDWDEDWIMVMIMITAIGITTTTTPTPATPQYDSSSYNSTEACKTVTEECAEGFYCSKAICGTTCLKVWYDAGWNYYSEDYGDGTYDNYNIDDE